MLTGSTGAEDGLVGTDLYGFVTSDGSRDNNDGCGASSHGRLESSKGGDCGDSTRSSTGGSVINMRCVIQAIKEPTTDPPLRVA